MKKNYISPNIEMEGIFNQDVIMASTAIFPPDNEINDWVD